MKKETIIALIVAAIVVVGVIVGVVATSLSKEDADGLYDPDLPDIDLPDDYTPDTYYHIETDVEAPETNRGSLHTHSYLSEIIVSPSCETRGIRRLYCSCGDSYTEEVAARGHSWVDATYSSPKKCSICGKTDGEPLGGDNVIIGKTNTNTDYVNVRLRPTTDSEIVTSIPPQTTFRILAQTYGYDGYIWYRAYYDGFEGYVRSDLVNIVS
ncbi:MAG: SH3 domain-containing protein [Ruminococcaceae bacterium]|nr:SH3 domain-containing protein [Oscillospiraceae bacterium]